MPVCICERHGRQIDTLVCPHVAEAYNNDLPSQGMVAVHGTWVDPATQMILFWCCPECAIQYGLGSENQPIDYVDIAEDFEQSLMPICNVCFDAWRKSERREITEMG